MVNTAFLASALCSALPLVSAQFLIQVNGGTAVDGQYITVSEVVGSPLLTVTTDATQATVNNIKSIGEFEELYDVSTNNTVGQAAGPNPNEVYLYYSPPGFGEGPVGVLQDFSDLVVFLETDPGYYLQWCSIPLSQAAGVEPQVSYPGFVAFSSGSNTDCTEMYFTWVSA